MSKINTAFESKIDVTVPYRWLWEEVEALHTFTDDQIRDAIRNAGLYILDQMGIDDISYDEFLVQSDYEDAVMEMIAARDKALKMVTLEAVITVAEAAEEFGKVERTVRDALEAGWIVCRQSGKTWLMLRKDAENRWRK